MFQEVCRIVLPTHPSLQRADRQRGGGEQPVRTLATVQDGKRVDVPINEGEIFLLPSNVPHSPRRPANTIGLVIERTRRPGERDGFQWYCESCGTLLHEEFVQVTDIETQLPPIFERFFGSIASRTCGRCGTVMEK